MKIYTLAHIHLSVVFLQNASRTALVYATNTIGENIPNITNHQIKHKEVRPDWNDKNDNANYAPRYHMEGLTNGSVAIFKEISDQVRKDLDCELFYSELNVTTSHIIFTI